LAAADAQLPRSPHAHTGPREHRDQWIEDVLGEPARANVASRRSSASHQEPPESRPRCRVGLLDSRLRPTDCRARTALGHACPRRTERHVRCARPECCAKCVSSSPERADTKATVKGHGRVIRSPVRKRPRLPISIERGPHPAIPADPDRAQIAAPNIHTIAGPAAGIGTSALATPRDDRRADVAPNARSGALLSSGHDEQIVREWRSIPGDMASRAPRCGLGPHMPKMTVG
jgi:hypothetical protein